MRINKKSDLPEWFDINNYNTFHSMKDDELFYQLSARWDLYIFCDGRDLGQIKNGVFVDAKMISEAVMNWDISGYDRFGVLPKTGGVKTLSIFDGLDINLKLNDHLKEKKKSDSRLMDFFYNTKSINSFANDEYEKNLYLKIDLDWPDGLLLQDLKNLIPKWREILNIQPRIDGGIYGWDITKKKLIDYSIFPLIDLFIWEKKMGYKITNGVLAVSVYPEGDYDSTNIVQTIKPNIEKIFNFYSIEQSRRELVDRGLLDKFIFEE